MSTESKQFFASSQTLAEILSWTFSLVRQTLLSDAEKKRIELALEEAIVNVIDHADAQDALRLEVGFRQENHLLEFELIDNGNPFNPLIHPIEDQTDLPLHERKPGGLGVMLIKKCMDSVTYRYEDGKNVLTLTKNLS